MWAFINKEEIVRKLSGKAPLLQLVRCCMVWAVNVECIRDLFHGSFQCLDRNRRNRGLQRAECTRCIRPLAEQGRRHVAAVAEGAVVVQVVDLKS